MPKKPVFFPVFVVRMASMQSAMANHYLSEELNENFFYDDVDHDEKQFLFQSEPMLDELDDEENVARAPINGQHVGRLCLLTRSS